MHQQFKILVVEDDTLIRDAVRRVLVHAGYETIYAPDGETALQLAAQHQPDLVLLDVNLPGMNGFEVCQRIKADPSLSATLVIIISGISINTQDQVKGLELGADAYLVRPISSQALLAHVKSMLRISASERALRLSEDKFKYVFDYSVLGKSLTLPGGEINANQALCEMLGYAPGELASRKWQDITHPEDIAISQLNMDELLSGQKEAVRFNKRYLHKNGSTVWTDLCSTVRWDRDSKPLYFITSISDITELKRAEDEICRLNAELEQRIIERTGQLQAAQEQLAYQERLAALGQLAGSVGHELRTPLGVIGNAVYYLQLLHPEADAKTQEYFSIIEFEVRTSEKIISDLLDFGRLKSAEREPILISELIHPILERLPAPPAVESALEIPADLPRIYADPQHVAQILANLITNAFQAMTDGGKLTISAAAQGDRIIITVQDTGPGIPPEDIAKLFQPLFTTKVKGIGLGLPISLKLAQANGGRIDVESQVGKGSTFTLTLPVYFAPQNGEKS